MAGGSGGLLDKRPPWVRLWVREGVHVEDLSSYIWDGGVGEKDVYSHLVIASFKSKEDYADLCPESP